MSSRQPAVYKQAKIPYSPFRHLVHSLWGYWEGGRKLMARYTGYFDESGHETARYLVFGGLVLDVEDPAPFDFAWKAAIAPLPSLHVAHFIDGRGKFAEWNGMGLESKCRILHDAMKVVQNFALQTFSFSLKMADYYEMDQELKFSEFVTHPYALGVRLSEIQLSQWANRNSIQDRIKAVFESREGHGEATMLFENAGLEGPSFEPKGPTALEAADLIAWAKLGQLTLSPNYQKCPVKIPPLLHSNDDFSVTDLRRIVKRFREETGMEIPPRSDSGPTAVLQKYPKRDRTRFERP